MFINNKRKYVRIRLQYNLKPPSLSTLVEATNVDCLSKNNVFDVGLMQKISMFSTERPGRACRGVLTFPTDAVCCNLQTILQIVDTFGRLC